MSTSSYYVEKNLRNRASLSLFLQMRKLRLRREALVKVITQRVASSPVCLMPSLLLQEAPQACCSDAI